MNKNDFTESKKITHIAFIMDGNGRWAKQRGLDRTLGHKEACDKLSIVLDLCIEFKIKFASLFAFSTENWNRPKYEISMLFNYLEIFFKTEIDNLIKKGVKIVTSGDITRLPKKTQNIINNAIMLTKDCDCLTANICLNYGSRDEILRACKKISNLCINNKIKVDEINQELISSSLYTNNMPDVDLLIRTSGEERISNFLLWQCAYAEFIFIKDFWPDFGRKQFIECIDIYNQRNRRFGAIK